jgi:hypothetical protein
MGLTTSQLATKSPPLQEKVKGKVTSSTLCRPTCVPTLVQRSLHSGCCLVAHATVRVLSLPSPPRPCSLAPSVTTPRYKTTVCQALRQTFRGKGLIDIDPHQLPRGHGGPEDAEVGDTSPLISFSNDGIQEPHRGFSRLVFDLPPNPSIDHLVAVILKYPRREESGRRKRLNPCPIGQYYTGSWI